MKYTIGVDLGGTNIAVGIVNENYEIVKKGSVPTLAQRGPEPIVHDMAELCKKLLAECEIAMDDVTGAGIACPGTVNPATGIVEYANNIKFSDFPLVALFSKEMDMPAENVKIGNDANLAALGEAVAGAAKGASSSVMITLGTGVGGGVILDGKMLMGCAFGGAELGHTVIELNGRQCSCGRKGCFEAYCSATALVKLTKEKFETTSGTLMHEMCENDINRVGGKTAFAAMKKGDKAGAEVVDAYISYLACGVANLINIFQPEVFTIGGGVSGEGDNLLVPLKEKVCEQIYSKDKTLKTDLRIATLGNDAGIIGAAAFANDK
ncbi:MAG: ROK family protein [Clostridia bacterium]|nr:ROK family protein [Clostridia bacterium]